MESLFGLARTERITGGVGIDAMDVFVACESYSHLAATEAGAHFLDVI